jgi:hypothetical protein
MPEVNVTVSVCASSSNPLSLTGIEGVLVSFTVRVNPRDLEDLLEALAQLDFPINPQIYHQADVTFVYADGREIAETATLVEFPGYADWATEVRQALSLYGFDSGSLHVTGMLEEIHTNGGEVHAAPDGAPYQYVRIMKHLYPPARA